MLHRYIDGMDDLRGRHYGVSSNDTWVLVQLDDGIEQVRLQLTSEQALQMSELLQQHAQKVKGSS